MDNVSDNSDTELDTVYYNLTNDEFHKVLKRNRKFLKKLHIATIKQVPQILSHLRVKNLELIIYIMHQFSKGRINMSQSDYIKLTRSKLKSKIMELKHDSDYLKMVHNDPGKTYNRPKLLRYLTSVRCVIGLFLNSLFKPKE